MSSPIQYPCIFNMHVIDAEFSPEFIEDGTFVWISFMFFGSQTPISTASVPFSACAVFNNTASMIVPRPKKGPPYLFTTVSLLEKGGKEIKPIGRGRINIETLTSDWKTRNSFSIPSSIDQKKTLCKINLICAFVPQMVQNIPQSVPQNTYTPNSYVYAENNVQFPSQINPETNPYENIEKEYIPYVSETKNDDVVRRKGTPIDENPYANM